MERKLNYNLAVVDHESGEIVYTRSFSSQEILEEHLREMASEVEIYQGIERSKDEDDEDFELERRRRDDDEDLDNINPF